MVEGGGEEGEWIAAWFQFCSGWNPIRIDNDYSVEVGEGGGGGRFQVEISMRLGNFHRHSKNRRWK